MCKHMGTGPEMGMGEWRAVGEWQGGQENVEGNGGTAKGTMRGARKGGIQQCPVTSCNV